MKEPMSGRTVLLVIDTKTNTYTRFVGGSKTGQWRSDQPLPAWDVEELRKDPRRYFGESDARATG